MFSYVMIVVNDLEKSRKFYDAVLGTLGFEAGVADKNRYFFRGPLGTFAITTPSSGGAVTAGEGTVGFVALSPEEVNVFHSAGLVSGGSAYEGEPAWHGEGTDAQLYMVYLRDPDGHKLCAVHRPLDVSQEVLEEIKAQVDAEVGTQG